MTEEERPRLQPRKSNVGRLATGRAKANIERAEWLYAVNQPELGITVSDVIREAVTNDALRRISLWQLLLSVPGWGEVHAARVIRNMHAAHGSTAAERKVKMNVGTIIDERRGGRLWVALADAMAREEAGGESVPAGFPYTATGL
ncbi:hypothetical protein [Cryobacterium sp. GrIS_2_6]|uniref:hypothetical protein n=1 Tax=Cryobacterium sp. GrIS_2_6 TaxID=3162785 RepID=UPI002E036B81|nr:hypothetical protein [Cryobacterium psychrotolerans]